jgi:hypothetical protein
MDYERFLLLISDFLDDELDRKLEREFMERFEDEFCRCYFNTFRKTVELCHEIETEKIPQKLHRKLIIRIEREKSLPYSPEPGRRKRAKCVVRKIKKSR